MRIGDNLEQGSESDQAYDVLSTMLRSALHAAMMLRAKVNVAHNAKQIELRVMLLHDAGASVHVHSIQNAAVGSTDAPSCIRPICRGVIDDRDAAIREKVLNQRPIRLLEQGVHLFTEP